MLILTWPLINKGLPFLLMNRQFSIN